MSHRKPTIDGMHTASGLQLVLHGNAVDLIQPSRRKRRRWPFFLLLVVAVAAAVWSYRR